MWKRSVARRRRCIRIVSRISVFMCMEVRQQMKYFFFFKERTVFQISSFLVGQEMCKKNNNPIYKMDFRRGFGKMARGGGAR